MGCPAKYSQMWAQTSFQRSLRASAKGLAYDIQLSYNHQSNRLAEAYIKFVK